MAVRIQVIGPRALQVESFEAPEPREGEVSVAIKISAISHGTELLLYRGQLDGLDLQADLDPTQKPGYPSSIGYAAVGRIVASSIPHRPVGQRVFCLAPHASHCTLSADLVFPIPDDIPDERALFFANSETAVTLCLDLQPLLGERCAVWGLGVVGSLAAALLSRFPLEKLYLFEPSPLRKDLVEELLGLSPVDPPDASARLELDASLDVSGSESALNAAMQQARFSGRIVVGSWFGNKMPQLALGAAFHRRRLQLISSQVSTIAPALQGRFDRERRQAIVWDLLRTKAFEKWISHRWMLHEASEAYRLLDQHSGTTMQTVFVHT